MERIFYFKRKYTICIYLLFSVLRCLSQVQFESSNLPIIKINTNGSTIPDAQKIEAFMEIINNSGQRRNNITDSANNYSGYIGIELRGSSSMQFPKKSYAIETRDARGENLDVSLLDMPEENDWVLYAPYSDKSLIRNVLEYKISNLINRYASRSKICELILNNEYIGVYVLFEKIKRNKNRVNISKCETKDTTGDALTGGYIFKIDKFAGENNDGWYSNIWSYPTSIKGLPYQYHYPKPEDIQAAQKNYLQKKIFEFENLMFSNEYKDPDKGYTEWIDVESFVDYFILNEFAKNVDEFRLSFFMYKDKDSKNRKIFFGPVWDFDLGFGNCNYYTAWPMQEWMVDAIRKNYTFVTQDPYPIPSWVYKIVDDPAFQQKVSTRWNTFRQNQLQTDNILKIIDSLANLVNEAKDRNFQKWNVLNKYIWPNNFIGATYQEEITYLKNWITVRLNWMDNAMMASTIKKTFTNTKEFKLYQNYPNPFNPSTRIEYSIPENSHVTIKIFNLLGQEIKTLVSAINKPGNYSINWIPENITGGVYYYQLKTNKYSSVKKMIYLE